MKMRAQIEVSPAKQILLFKQNNDCTQITVVDSMQITTKLKK